MYRDSRRLRLALALLILTSFTIITVDYRAGDGAVLASVRRGAAAVFGPIERAVTSVVRPIGNALSTLGDLGSLNDEVKQLRDDNTALRNELSQTDDIRREAEELRKLLSLARRGQYKILTARVVGVGPDNFEWTATIDAGSRDGIRKGQTVVNGDGLVGRILATAPFTSQVLLAIDPTFTVYARMAASGETGGVTGNGLGDLRLELVNPEARVRPSEPVISAGSSIVAGLPIGIATGTERTRVSLTRRVRVTPFVRFTALDTVGVVVQPPRSDPRNAVLPSPLPTPRPSPSPGTGSTPGLPASPAATASATPTTRRS